MQIPSALPENFKPVGNIKHAYAVAELMYAYHDVFQCETFSKEDCFFLGLISCMEHHAADMLWSNGYNAEKTNHFSTFIFCVDLPPKYFMDTFSLLGNPKLIHEMALFWWADTCVEKYGGYAGEIVTPEERLVGMKMECYGAESRLYRDRMAIIKWLEDWMESHHINISEVHV